jgi:hypothetical protein
MAIESREKKKPSAKISVSAEMKKTSKAWKAENSVINESNENISGYEMKLKERRNGSAGSGAGSLKI